MNNLAQQPKPKMEPVIDDGSILDKDILLRRFILGSNKHNRQYKERVVLVNNDKHNPTTVYPITASSMQYGANGLSVYSSILFYPYKALWNTFLNLPPNLKGVVHDYGVLKFNAGELRKSFEEIQIAYDEDAKDKHLGRRYSHVLIGLESPPDEDNIESLMLWKEISTYISSTNPFTVDPSIINHPGLFPIP